MDRIILPLPCPDLRPRPALEHADHPSRLDDAVPRPTRCSAHVKDPALAVTAVDFG
jgi:hypothetical protein